MNGKKAFFTGLRDYLASRQTKAHKTALSSGFLEEVERAFEEHSGLSVVSNEAPYRFAFDGEAAHLSFERVCRKLLGNRVNKDKGFQAVSSLLGERAVYEGIHQGRFKAKLLRGRDMLVAYRTIRSCLSEPKTDQLSPGLLQFMANPRLGLLALYDTEVEEGKRPVARALLWEVFEAEAEAEAGVSVSPTRESSPRLFLDSVYAQGSTLYRDVLRNLAREAGYRVKYSDSALAGWPLLYGERPLKVEFGIFVVNFGFGATKPLPIPWLDSMNWGSFETFIEKRSFEEAFLGMHPALRMGNVGDPGEELPQSPSEGWARLFPMAKDVLSMIGKTELRLSVLHAPAPKAAGAEEDADERDIQHTLWPASVVDAMALQLERNTYVKDSPY